jgi:two-component system OmpR family sensor kinase
MRLVLRVTLAIFLFVTISSAMIGYFAIAKYQTSQINRLDDSLDANIKELVATKEDPLKVAQYLAQVSSIPLTVEYLSDIGLVTVLTINGPTFSSFPNSLLLSRARHDAFNFGSDLRIRTFEMTGGKKLILGESRAVINQDVETLTRDLLLFILAIDLLAGLMAFLVFRRDGKLNQVSRLIEEQRKAMQQFLGDASHELRTPLTVVKGYVDLARSSSNIQKQEVFLEKSSSEIIRMETIINDLLFLAEVGEVQAEELEAVDVALIVEDHLQILQALQPERIIESMIGPRVVLHADAKLIARLVGNLFSNIRRHTPEGAPVAVELFTKEGEIVLIVEDGGPGLVDYPEKPRILKRFTPQRSTPSGGSGLGLSIISGVIERYHGKLFLQRSKLGGLKVEVRFPLLKEYEIG